MEIISARITRQDLVDRYTTAYPALVKGVVDLAQGIIAVDAEWHADLEALLLEDGSAQNDLWGFNMLPLEPAQSFLEYESLINIRPAQKNFSLEVTDPGLRDRIKAVVDRLVDYEGIAGVREPESTYGSSDSIPAGFGGATSYPCFKHHKQLTMEKWHSFKPWQRVLMIANEFGRAKAFLRSGNIDGLTDCYERALEIFHITVEAACIEGLPPEIIHGLLRLRDRTAKLLVECRLDPEENQRIRDELTRLDPEGAALFQEQVTVGAEARG
jgi:hypothetical protein